MNLFLIGCRGSGKSTVGALVAKQFSWRFIDLDRRIVKDAGCTITAIFAKEGESGFRRREREACQRLRGLKRNVIAMGGGSLNDAENRIMVKRLGKVIWLRAPAAVLWSRIAKDPHTAQNRPNLTAGGGLSELEATLAAREPLYRAAAHHIIDTMSQTPSQVAEAIEIWFHADDARSQSQ